MKQENKLRMELKDPLTRADMLQIINDPEICSGDLRDLLRRIIEERF